MEPVDCHPEAENRPLPLVVEIMASKVGAFSASKAGSSPRRHQPVAIMQMKSWVSGLHLVLTVASMGIDSCNPRVRSTLQIIKTTHNGDQ